MSTNEEEKVIDEIMNRTKLDLVPVPDELENRINKWVQMKKRSKRSSKLKYSLGAAAAGIVLAGTVLLSPTAMTYAKEIPLLGAALSWFEQLDESKGVKTAEENGYKPANPYTFTVGEYEMEMDHLYLEDKELFFTLAVKGGRINDIVFKDKYGYNFKMGEYLEVAVESKDFKRDEESVAGGASTSGIQKISDEFYVMMKHTLYVDPVSVEEFLNNPRNALTFDVSVDGKTSSIEVPVAQSKIKLGKHLAQNVNIEIENQNSFNVEKLSVYPTRMVLEITGGSEEAFLKMVSNEKNSPYLKDNNGNVYPLRLLQVNSNDYKLESRSTLYFDQEVKDLNLHVVKETKEELVVPLNIIKE
ncbi:hypothetical protein SM124_10515 [Bacillus sp. 31A1R]|uniref:DUF4179 domain-containing protein n=1 Tax=Robertmurraya mangrovi TaxID=3098077 RepID=A0ABU5IYH2_9BACI|nr:hypothetical protein [Bacillus sp. 31A1R]MDZ5472181.1 hypothetical protein [Bacillus sp. 31A1R]